MVKIVDSDRHQLNTSYISFSFGFGFNRRRLITFLTLFLKEAVRNTL